MAEVYDQRTGQMCCNRSITEAEITAVNREIEQLSIQQPRPPVKRRLDILLRYRAELQAHLSKLTEQEKAFQAQVRLVPQIGYVRHGDVEFRFTKEQLDEMERRLCSGE